MDQIANIRVIHVVLRSRYSRVVALPSWLRSHTSLPTAHTVDAAVAIDEDPVAVDKEEEERVASASCEAFQAEETETVAAAVESRTAEVEREQNFAAAAVVVDAVAWQKEAAA
jgi:hypothetical protein